jgi:hypothetical protein
VSGGPAGTSGIVIAQVERPPPERLRLPLDRSLKTVFVLGAGFSRPLGGLLLDQLLEEMERDVVEELFPATKDERPALATGMCGARILCRAGIQQRLWSNPEDFLEKLETAARQQQGPTHQPVASLSLLSTIIRRGIDYVHHGSAGRGTHYDSFPPLPELVRSARLAIAADCEVFLRGAQPLKEERWGPYRRWAMGLGTNHDIITFNYDRVPDLLSGHERSRLHVLKPGQTETVHTQAHDAQRRNCARVLKVHGSTDWAVFPDRRVVIDQDFDTQLVRTDGAEPLIGVPGPAKVEISTAQGGPLAGLWDLAKVALEEAQVIVLIGYRFPESDAYARWFVLEALRNNVRGKRANETLLVQTVLGPDTASASRVRHLIEAATGGKVHVEQLPFVTQEFFDVAW